MPFDQYAFGSADYFESIALDAADNIYAVGNGFRLIKYNSNGVVDSSYGKNGRFNDVPQSKLANIANQILLQKDGKAIIAGVFGEAINGNTKNDFGVIRLTTNGILDSTFNNTGILRLDFNGNDVCNSLAIQADGKIVICGKIADNDSTAVVRLKVDGTLDSSFGEYGIVKNKFGDYKDDNLTTILVRDNNKIITCGYTEQSGNQKIVVLQYKFNGDPDSTFGVNGIVLMPFQGYAPFPYGMCLLNDGKVVIVNRFLFGGGGLIRLNIDGTIDNSFGQNGEVILSPSLGTLYPSTMRIDKSSNIHVAGYININGEDDSYYIRLMPNGSIDTKYSSTGIVTSVSQEEDRINDIAIQTDGKIITSGYNYVDQATTQYSLIRYTLFPLNITSENDTEGYFKIFPNPTRDNYINITTTVDDNILIYDMVGRKYKDIKVTKGENQIDIKTLPSGKYIIINGSRNKRSELLIVF